ncbi:MAG: MFS transporter [Acidimicrobiales bacterium]
MSVRTYTKLLRTPGVAYLMGTSLLGRVPNGMLSLALVLLVSRDGSYARAGDVVAAYVTGIALAGPLLGRLVDRIGRAIVLRPAALLKAGLLCGLALLPQHAIAAVTGCAFAAGLCSPPVVASTRSLWPDLLQADAVQGIYALEATLQELVFITGPTLVAIVVGLSGPSAAVLVTAGILAVGVLAFSFHPAVSARPERAVHESTGQRAPDRKGVPLPIPLLVAGVVIVGGFSIVELSTVAFARSHGSPGLAGVALAVWSAGSLTGGLLLGARAASSRAPRRRLAELLTVLAAATLLPAAASQIWSLALLLLVAGLSIAPTFASLYSLAAAEVEQGRQNEGFGWLTASLLIGGALGGLGGGWLVQTCGSHVGYLVAGGVIALGTPPLVLTARQPGLKVILGRGSPGEQVLGETGADRVSGPVKREKDSDRLHL